MFDFFIMMIVSAALFAMVFWLWALLDCLLRPSGRFERKFGNVNSKLAWSAIIFFGNCIGAAAYFFIAGTRRHPAVSDPAVMEDRKRIKKMIADGRVTPEEAERLLLALGHEGATAGSRAARIGYGLIIFLLFACLAFLAFRYFSIKADLERKAVVERKFEQLQKQTAAEKKSVTNAAPSTNNMPNAGELLKHVPRLSLAEKDVSSFETRGIFEMAENKAGAPLKWGFIFSAKKPDQIAVRLFDLHDGAMLFMGTANQCMLYDPVSAEILLFDLSPIFELKTERKKSADNDSDDPRLTFDFAMRRKVENPATRTVMDLRSFFDVGIPPEVKTADGKNFIIETKSKRGNRVVAQLNLPNKACAMLKLYADGLSVPMLAFNEILVNQEIPKERFPFPMESLLASGLPIRRVNISDKLEIAGAMEKFIRTIMVRLALSGVDDQKLKRVIEMMSMRKLNWDELKKHDEKASVILRSIFGDQRAGPEKITGPPLH